MGYVESALEIVLQQCEEVVASSVVVFRQRRNARRLAVGLEHLMPDVELIGVTVSRSCRRAENL